MNLLKASLVLLPLLSIISCANKYGEWTPLTDEYSSVRLGERYGVITENHVFDGR